MTTPTDLRLIIVDDDRRLRDSVVTMLTTQEVDGGGAGAALIKDRVEEQDSITLSPLTDLADAVARRIRGNPRKKDETSSAEGYIDVLAGGATDSPHLGPVLLLLHLNVLTKEHPSRLSRNGSALYEEILARVAGCAPEGGSFPFIPHVLFYSIEPAGKGDGQAASEHCRRRLRITKLANSAKLDAGDIVWQLPEGDGNGAISRATNFWRLVWASGKPALDYALDVVDTVLEKANANFRHSFSDLRRPVVRVLLGAVQSGDVPWDEARLILQALSQSEPPSHVYTSGESIKKYPIKVLESYRAVQSHTLPRQQRAQMASRHRYLLIDDQVPGVEYTWQEGAVWVGEEGARRQLAIDPSDSGWGASLSCITRGEVVCLRSPSLLTEFISREGEGAKNRQLQWDAVFLDYDFGGGNNGGHFLREIKNRQFDLPVALFTGLDDSDLAKWSLSHGSSAYFVKEGRESEGRNSLYAYNNLRNIIDSLSLQTGRELWQHFVAVEQRLEEIEESVWSQSYAHLPNPSAYDPPAVTWNFRQAFYWLFLAQREIQEAYQERPHISASNADSIPRVGECAAAVSVHCQTAFEHLIACVGILRRGQSVTLRQWADDLRKNGISGINGALQRAGFMTSTFDLRCLRTREKDSHLAEPKFEEAINCLESVLTNSKEILAGFSPGAPARTNLSVVDRLTATNSPQPPKSKSKATRNHAETAELGAKEIVEGWADLVCPGSKQEIVRLWSQHPHQAMAFVSGVLSDPSKNLSKTGDQWNKLIFNQHRLLLVDDDYRSTGWGTALEILCGPASITPWTLADLSSKDGRDLDQFDMVLLDLRMPDERRTSPSPEVGIDTLRRLRLANRSVPVLMLTASDEAYWTYRALRIGATNYFLKRYGGTSKSQTATQFFSMILELTRLLGRNSPARKLWRAIVGLEGLRPGVIPDVASLGRHVPELRAQPGKIPQQLNEFISKRLERAYDSYIQTMSNNFQYNSRIDVDRWLLEGLAHPRYRPAQTSNQLYSLLLALKCGQLVECLAMLTMAFEFPNDPRTKSAHDVLNGNLYQVQKGQPEAFKNVANQIWAERNPAAHGFLTVGKSTSAKTAPAALAASDPAGATGRAISCAEEWMRWLGWS